MPTVGSVTKTIRINPSDLAVIEGLMADGTSWSGAIHKLCGGVPIKRDAPKNDSLKDIEAMAGLLGMKTEELLSAVCEGLNDGSLTVDGGAVRGVPELDLSDFEDACHERGIRPQDALDRTTKTLRSGR